MKPSFPVGNNISDHSEPSKTKSESGKSILNTCAQFLRLVVLNLQGWMVMAISFWLNQYPWEELCNKIIQNYTVVSKADKK